MPVIRGDYNLLSLVWGNLIDNAVKYTRTRELAVIIIGAVVRPRMKFIFHIRDNGVGFDMKYSRQTLWRFSSACTLLHSLKVLVSGWPMFKGLSSDMAAEPGLKLNLTRGHQFTFRFLKDKTTVS